MTAGGRPTRSPSPVTWWQLGPAPFHCCYCCWQHTIPTEQGSELREVNMVHSFNSLTKTRMAVQRCMCSTNLCATRHKRQQMAPTEHHWETQRAIRVTSVASCMHEHSKSIMVGLIRQGTPPDAGHARSSCMHSPPSARATGCGNVALGRPDPSAAPLAFMALSSASASCGTS
jgi:hypothetical protein